MHNFQKYTHLEAFLRKIPHLKKYNHPSIGKHGLVQIGQHVTVGDILTSSGEGKKEIREDFSWYFTLKMLKKLITADVPP